ncbi:hypothetical protein 1 [Wuhan pillworm virus 3]|uniref:hypothetical protein 1 n=1 Tax=Wuhan pillworm virus 3 TaxID=1923746 RepID=UPI00090CC06B|nr:hypothetical protein 1 [Wuhan pillworm virus 3]APG75926.1 hypothetical protein 1 [Wuhan pillworm virus 3]
MDYNLIIYTILFLFFLLWKMSHDIFYKFIDWIRKGHVLDFLREHGWQIILFIFGLHLTQRWTFEIRNLIENYNAWTTPDMCWDFPQLTWDPTTALQYIPPSTSRFWNLLMLFCWFINWLSMRTLGIKFHALQPGSDFIIANLPPTQVRIKVVTRNSQIAYGVGAVFKWQGRIFLATVKHLLKDACFIQAGRDNFWVDLDQSYRSIHSDGVVWELNSGITSKLGVKLGSVGQITGQLAVSTVSTDLKQSSGIVYLLDKIVCYTGSTEVGFSGAPYLAGSRIYGIHIGEASGRNIGYDLHDAMRRYDSPEMTEESRKEGFGTEGEDVAKDYYKTSGKSNMRTSGPSNIYFADPTQSYKDKVDYSNLKSTPWALDDEPREGWERRVTKLESKIDNVIDLIQSTLSKQDGDVPLEQTTGSSQKSGLDFQRGPQSTPVTPHAKRAQRNGSISSQDSVLSAKPNVSSQSHLSKNQKRKLRQKSKKPALAMSKKPSRDTVALALELLQKPGP